MNQQTKVSIRPQVTMLSVLKHIEYETWFALAEFIDNAIDSYLKNIELLKEIEGNDFVLVVKVEIDELENTFTEYSNPEMINNNKETAPSKRLSRIIKGYHKIVYGNILAEEIGLTNIRNKSPRFNNWINTIENTLK